MTHLFKSIPHPCLPFRQPSRRQYRKAFLIPLTGLVLACASCSDSQPAPEPPPVPVTDTQPVGEGLKVIGYAMLGAAVVIVAGRLIR